MSDLTLGLAPYHIPTIASGHYNIKANLINDLNNGLKQDINFHVAGYNASIPQNEVLAVYPPIEHTGNFAGTFPHIQFRRSTLPWEYNVVDSNKKEEFEKALNYPSMKEKEDFLNNKKIPFDVNFKGDEADKLVYLNSTIKGDYTSPYIFLVLLKEEELKNFTIIDTDTNQLASSTESPAEPKPLKVIACNNSDLFPKADLIQKLAHVRVQEHSELKDLNLPKETSILISHRMVEANTKYKAFVCYYAQEIKEEDSKEKFKMILDLTVNSALEYLIILNEWSFESIGAELYQVDKKKLENYPHKLPDSIKNSEIVAIDLNNLETLTDDFKPFESLIKENHEYKKCLTEIELKFINGLKTLPETTPQNQAISGSKIKEWLEINVNIFINALKGIDQTKSYTINEFQKILESDNNHINEYLQYNGNNLKGYLHKLELQPFKSFIKSPTVTDDSSKEEIEKDIITKLLNTSRIPLEHQLKAGGKMVSWYQGPFSNNKSKFNILERFKTVPDHQDYLNLFNEDTNMYDMTYSAAWQLGRLLIMNDNKVLQELKKWKYDLELYNLVLEQNKLSYLPALSINAPSIPDVLMNYVTELIQFRNFPLYYLLPHEDLSTEESIKYFKIDNSWILAFLFGIFSVGPKLEISDFTKYLYREEIFDKKDINGWSEIKPQLHTLLNILTQQSADNNISNIEELQADIIEKCTNIISSNKSELEAINRNKPNQNRKSELEKEINFYNRIIEILNRIKNEMWYVFNIKTDYYGILLQSQTIKNWPHLVIELNQSHDYHYVTSINNSLRLYVTDKEISNIEMYLKNEDAHFGFENMEVDEDSIAFNEKYTIKELKEINSSVDLANKLIYKQPKVKFEF